MRLQSFFWTVFTTKRSRMKYFHVPGLIISIPFCLCQQITLHCGTVNELLSVTETERCVYSASMKSPGACSIRSTLPTTTDVNSPITETISELWVDPSHHRCNLIGQKWNTMIWIVSLGDNLHYFVTHLPCLFAAFFSIDWLGMYCELLLEQRVQSQHYGKVNLYSFCKTRNKCFSCAWKIISF